MSYACFFGDVLSFKGQLSFAIVLAILIIGCARTGKCPVSYHKLDTLRSEVVPDSNCTAMRVIEANPNHSEEGERKRTGLPNYATGPFRPKPIGINFYRIDSRFPQYLLCRYDTWDVSYDTRNEPKWFEAALQQVRASGSSAFPSFDWIAVAIVNAADHKDASTFESSYKVGIIVRASEVFGFDRTLEEIIASAQVNRRPFKFIPSAMTPREQQNWIIVEEHASLNAAH